MVPVLRARPNPPQAARAPRETEAAVRNLASVWAVIALALPESSVWHGDEENDLTCGLDRKTLRCGREK